MNNSRISHWRVYFPCAIGEKGESFVEVSETAAQQLQRDLAHAKSPLSTTTLVTGRSVDIRTSRSLYVTLSQVVALEPRED